MASSWYTNGLLKVADGTVDWIADTIKVLLVGTTFTFDKTNVFVSTIVAGEVDGGASYVGGFSGAGRKTLGGKTITKDDPNGRVIYDADDVPYIALDIVTPVDKKISAAIVYRNGTADTDSILLGCNDFSDLITDGHDINLKWNVLGILRHLVI